MDARASLTRLGTSLTTQTCSRPTPLWLAKRTSVARGVPTRVLSSRIAS
ncbi:hypothetical protein L917_20634 [Phytophthora nicotianae]|uniref:Uncharacterized protein n=1 Tax=Phytophthora nicotianae TaxID=4792 RepID=W2K0D0_PHYNI|nr:hypothetical protein L917_20634 [Phytophthora nicotianae]